MRQSKPATIIQFMPGSSGEEDANLYMRGVNEAHGGKVLEASSLLEILDVFGEDGLRAYLVAFKEGEADLKEGL